MEEKIIHFLLRSQDQETPDGDEAQPESAERKEHQADGQTGEQNVQSETAVELGGEASERDQAKEVSVLLRDGHMLSSTKVLTWLCLLQEHGTGAADASQSEGHQSQLTARMASQRQTEKKTQVRRVYKIGTF